LYFVKALVTSGVVLCMIVTTLLACSCPFIASHNSQQILCSQTLQYLG